MELQRRHSVYLNLYLCGLFCLKRDIIYICSILEESGVDTSKHLLVLLFYFDNTTDLTELVNNGLEIILKVKVFIIFL